MHSISYHRIPVCQIIHISSRSMSELSIFSPSKVKIMQKQNLKWELRGGGEVREKQEESEKVNVHAYMSTLILNAEWVQVVGAHGQGQKQRLRGPAVNGQSGLYDHFISKDINTLTQQEGVNNELTNYRRDRKGGRGLQREGQTKKGINKEMPGDGIT